MIYNDLNPLLATATPFPFKGLVKAADHGLKIAVLGDVHLGHPNTTTPEVIRGLYEVFPDTPATWALDLIIFEGDLFDRLLNLPDDTVCEIKLWMTRFLKLCQKHDIVVRVLEGTPSHDRRQPIHFTLLNTLSEIGADIEYVQVLSIERLERFGIDILYIPDEWRHEPDDTWKDVQQALAERGLTKVDFIVMHGAFTYQLPPQVQASCHIPERYLEIVRYFVFIGHVHKYSMFDRIIASGSVDRLTHGEEEPKGHTRVVVRGPGDTEVVFVENRLAKQYRTINCAGLTVDEAWQSLAVLETLPNDSYVRIAANSDDAIISSLVELRSRFPLLNFSTLKTDKPRTHRESLQNIITPYTPASITKTNVSELLIGRLQARQVDPALIERARLLLNGHLT